MNISLYKLTLENFKCHKHLEIDFGGMDTSIYGDNATGKTSVYDALTWLLFDRDSLGNGKNAEFKPLDAEGNVADHEAQTSVEAVLMVDEKAVVLKRTYQEVWTTRRGNPEPVFSGNTSDYFVNGVPMKKGGYMDVVNDMVDEDTFKLLTNVHYFADEMPWQKRREVLFDAAGTMDDHTIMAASPRFSSLLDSIGSMSVGDFKKRLQAERKTYVVTRDELPTRLNECEKTIEEISGIDFDAIRAKISELESKRETLSGELASLQHSAAIDAKKVEMERLELQLQQLNAENTAYRRAQEANVPNAAEQKKRVAMLEARITALDTNIAKYKKAVLAAENNVAVQRTKWQTINAEKFTKKGVCPTCGQPLPAEEIAAAKEKFEQNKQARLAEIMDAADTYKQVITQQNEAVDNANATKVDLEGELNELREQIHTAESNAVVISDIEGYQEHTEAIKAQLAVINKEIFTLSQEAHIVVMAKRSKLEEVTSELRRLMSELGRESTLQYTKERMEALREDAENAAAKLAEIDNLLWELEEYSRYKVSFIEDSINGMFKRVKFRLYREQANGGVEERCDVTYNGVPYSSLNNGMRINVGVDIINMLSALRNVTVPLFIDNAESVTDLEAGAMQMIRLVVSADDAKLRIERE